MPRNSPSHVTDNPDMTASVWRPSDSTGKLRPFISWLNSLLAHHQLDKPSGTLVVKYLDEGTDTPAILKKATAQGRHVQGAGYPGSRTDNSQSTSDVKRRNTMKASTQDQAEGTFHELKGKV